MKKEELLEILSRIDNGPDEIRNFIIEDINERAIFHFNKIYPVKIRGDYQLTAFDVLTLVREAPSMYDTDLFYKVDGDFSVCQSDEINDLSSFIASLLEVNYETSEWEKTYNDLTKDLKNKIETNFKTERIQNYIKEFGCELNKKDFEEFYY